jgi:hypothetical protein
MELVERLHNKWIRKYEATLIKRICYPMILEQKGAQ